MGLMNSRRAVLNYGAYEGASQSRIAMDDSADDSVQDFKPRLRPDG